MLVGFAAETENVIEYARRKLEEKNCDMIVANRVGAKTVGGEDSAFESDTNEVAMVLRGGEVVEVARAPKREIADRILGQVVRLRQRAGVAR